MPWEGPLQQVVQSITGPVVQAAAVVAVVVFGAGLAMSENGSSMRRGLSILFGLCIAFAAATFFLDFFGFADRLMVTARDRPEGWDLPVAQALSAPVLMAGMPREYAIAMGTIALVLGLALRIWWLGLLWWALAHVIGLWAARSDPRFFDVLRRHLALPGHLDA
ncbi:hypothetical protein LTR94_023985 [Friedmanniomyces endolithicus]|nr:hypothetical protein LTR94_023985 [Friedmanniomyces endolithicus]